MLWIISASCDLGTDSTNEIFRKSSQGGLSFSLDLSQAPTEISRVEAELSRYGYDTIRVQLAIEGDSAFCEITAIPIGRWKITVKAYGTDEIVDFIGSDYVDVVGGQTVEVEIFLQYANGNIFLVVRWPSGRAHNTISLDGIDDFGEVTSSPSLSSIDTACTLEAWVRPSSSYYNTVLSKGSVNYFLQLLTDNAVSFIAKDMTIDFSGAYSYWGRIVVPCQSLVERWTHVAVSFSQSAGLKFYVNGHLIHMASTVGVIAGTGGAFRVGAREDTLYTEYYTGEIDEVRVWNVDRTLSEIRATIREELTGVEPGLIGYWKFNEENGSTIAHDSSPYHNDLTLHGNPTFVKSGAF